uniref:HRDC domain-containing protein n=1 Tax=Rhabditophanes sp. KR3021 TaxID=114890 RepID=A0AC35TPK5_9BILA
MKHHAGKKHISDSEHPYFAELKDIEVDGKLLKEQSVLVIDPCEQVELTFIDTVKGLEELIVFLNKQEEFAVDLEHHDLRSFLGITCLIQISTAFKDFIIDPFPIWNEMWQLNEPFTDPAILKVFHGAHSDIIWLQRDFGIYVVNMIDTQAVMKACNITPLGLSSLIRRYYNIELDKKYQRADWRYRPLTKEMLTYARCDTHYLLGAKNLVVNDCLKMGNDFQNLVRQAFDESTVICMSHFEQPRFVLEIVGKHKAKYTRFSLLQRLALKRLFKWRDAVAREEDESLNYVIKDDALFSIAEVMPEDVQGLLNTCIPTPPLLTKHANELSSLLYKMREYSEDMCAKLLEEEEVHVAEEVKANGPTTHSRNEDDLRVQAMFDKMDCTSEYVNTSVPKTVCSDERFGEFPKIEINAGSDVLKLVKLTAEIQKEGKSVIKKAPFHLKNRLRKVIPISVVPAVKQVFEEQSELATPFEQHLLALMELERNQPDANTMRDLRIKEAQVKCKKGWAEM